MHCPPVGPLSPMNVLVLMPYQYDTAPSQRYRIEQWARILSGHGVNFEFVPFESSELNEVIHLPGHALEKSRELLRCIWQRATKSIENTWDVIFLHRELLPIGPPVLEQVLARKGIPIVYDFDDAIFLPDVSEANRKFKWLKSPKKTGTICRLSTHVIVGNNYLRDYALQYTGNVSVVPTTIDTDRYTPKKSYNIADIPVIGWSGSRTTLRHLKIIEPYLRALRKELNFRLKVIGSEGYTIRGIHVDSRAWNRNTEVDDLRSFDVGIMPLPDEEWSLGKCGFKALLYMSVGVPSVISPVGVNVEIIEDGRNGFMADTEKEWVEKLSLLLSNRELRERFGSEGRKTVEERYAAKKHALRVLEILNWAKTQGRSSHSALSLLQ